MRDVDLAGLTVRLAGGVDGEGGGDGPLVVLLHGFGAPGDDLATLWRVIDAPKGTRWAFPAAPLSLHAGPQRTHGGSGASREPRAWWMVDLQQRLDAPERGQLESLTRDVPPGIARACAGIVSVLDELDTLLRPTKVVLGGFSQGAMLACDVALRTESRLAGVALLSGTLLAAEEWGPLASRMKAVPVFQSHGTGDPLLPFQHAERLRDLLSAGGVQVTWVPFRGGHEIADVVVGAFGRWLRIVLA